MLSAVFRIYGEAFRDLSRSVWLLSGVALVNRAGTMVLPFLSLYLIEELGLSKATAASILLSFGLGSMAGSFLGGWGSRLVGPVRVQELSLLTGGAAYLVLGQIRSPLGLHLGFFAASMLNDAFRPATMAACSDMAPPESKTRALALLRLAVNLGMAIGPAAGGWLASIDYRWIFIVDGLTCLLAAGLLWLTVGRQERKAREQGGGVRPGGSSAWADPPFLALMGLVFLLGIAFFQVWIALPIYFHESYHLGERAIGLVLSINAGLIVLFEMAVVRLLEKRDHLILFGAGSLLVGAGIAILPLGAGFGLAIGSTVIWTAGEMLSLPFSNGLVAIRAGKHTSSSYMGLYSMTFSASFIVAPPAGMWIYSRLGGDALCLSVGLAGLGVLVGSLLLLPWFRR